MTKKANEKTRTHARDVQPAGAIDPSLLETKVFRRPSDATEPLFVSHDLNESLVGRRAASRVALGPGVHEGAAGYAAARSFASIEAVRPVSLLKGLPKVADAEARIRAVSTPHHLASLRGMVEAALTAICSSLGIEGRLEDVRMALEAAPLAGFAVPFTLAGSESRGVARLCPSLCATFLSALTRCDVAPIVTRPDPVSAAVLGHGVLLALNALTKSGLTSARLVEGPLRIERRATVTIELRLDVAGTPGFAQISLDDSAARTLARRLESEAVISQESSASGGADLGPTLSEAAIDALLCMGPVRLAARSVRELRRGDAICPDPAATLQNGFPQGRAFLAATGRLGSASAAVGRINGFNFTIQAVGQVRPTVEEVDVTTPLTNCSGLTVDAHLVLASIPMTLAELSRLGEGSILKLPDALPRVTIRVGEQAIALGELVDVEGVLGVRITEGGA